MKRKAFKAIALTLVTVIILSTTVTGFAATEEESDFPCGGVIEEVDVEILYAPLTSRVVIGGFGPIITGTVLKVTYPDGESEILTVEQNGNEYCAGDFSVYVPYFDFGGVIINYGIVSETIHISRDIENFIGYSGETDFVYLNLPSVKDIITDIIYLIYTYSRIWS